MMNQRGRNRAQEMRIPVGTAIPLGIRGARERDCSSSLFINPYVIVARVLTRAIARSLILIQRRHEFD